MFAVIVFLFWNYTYLDLYTYVQYFYSNTYSFTYHTFDRTALIIFYDKSITLMYTVFKYLLLKITSTYRKFYQYLSSFRFSMYIILHYNYGLFGFPFYLFFSILYYSLKSNKFVVIDTRWFHFDYLFFRWWVLLMAN